MPKLLHLHITPTGYRKKMALYMTRAKLSNEAFKGYVENPSDREAALQKLTGGLGMTMHKMYFSVSTAEIVTIAEGTAAAMAAAEMVIGSSGTTTSIEVIELIDSKSMTAAMETANRVVSTYQAPNK